MKVVGGNMNPEELHSKGKCINPSCSDKDITITGEDNLMGTLLVESARDKKYGYLKRLLINSVAQGQNCYPNINTHV